MAPNIVNASSTRSGAGEIAITAAPAAAMRCWSSDSSPARTASQAAAVASSLLTNSIAALCCRAWKVPITLPNCSRIRRWAVTACTHHWITPAVVAATSPRTTQRARSGSMPVSTSESRTRWLSSRSTPASATRSVPEMGSTVAVGFSVSTAAHTSSPSRVRAPTRTMRAAHTPAVTSEAPLSSQCPSPAPACRSPSPGSTTAAGTPAARSRSTDRAAGAGSASSATAPAATVGSSGPGNSDLPADSSTQAASISRPP